MSTSSPAQLVDMNNHERTPITLSTPRLGSSQTNEINAAQVLAETVVLENYFQDGFGQEMNSDEQEENDDGDEDEQDEVVSDEDLPIVDNSKTRPALAWADKFILDMRRKGGRQTENSVLKLWKVCRKLLQNFLALPYTLYLIRRGFPMR